MYRKGAGSTIKEKQHETLDKAYTDFLKTHDLLGKSVDASNDAYLYIIFIF